MWLKFEELDDDLKEQAIARFANAGTAGDNYWYNVVHSAGVFCRNKNPFHEGNHLNDSTEATAHNPKPKTQNLFNEIEI